MKSTSYQIATERRNEWMREHDRREPTVAELAALVEKALDADDARTEQALERARQALHKYHSTRRTQLETRQRDLVAGTPHAFDRIPTVQFIPGEGNVVTADMTREQAVKIDIRNSASVVRAETKREQWRRIMAKHDADKTWPELHNESNASE